MAAPSFVRVQDSHATGMTVTTGSGLGMSFNDTGIEDGKVVILGVLQDGTGTGPSLTGLDGVEALDGTANSMTSIGTFDVGGTVSAKIVLWIGRLTIGGAWIFNVSTAGDDLYCQSWLFADVNTGTTLADVIEHNGGTTPNTSKGTSATISDAAVITTGVDRLALNVVGVNDDNAVDAFAGMTGGTWAEASAEHAASAGTDGCIQLQTAAMASAGTIDGGTDGMAASDGWGVVGFALIGTTAATAYAPVPPNRSQSVLLRL